jgi:hypothetical protein
VVKCHAGCEKNSALRGFVTKTFEDAWPVAVAEALDGVDFHERRKWVKALEWTRPRWEAAYNRAETSREELALVLIGEERGERLPDRACDLCGREIPAGRRGPGVRYCSDVCRQRADYQNRVAA